MPRAKTSSAGGKPKPVLPPSGPKPYQRSTILVENDEVQRQKKRLVTYTPPKSTNKV